MKTGKFGWAWRLTASFVVMMCFVGCGGSGGGFTETASIDLTADRDSVNADGMSSVTITASVTDSTGASVAQYTNVEFTTTNGHFKNGSQSYGLSTADDSGTAIVSLIAPDTPGFAEVTCEANGVTQFIRIDFLHYDNSGDAVAEEFGLSVEYHNLSGLWRSGLENTITARLGDIYGNAVQDGVSVSFSTYNTGGFFDPDVAVTAGAIDDSTIYQAGTAASTLFTTSSPVPAQGMVSVTAETDGGSTTHVTSIAVTPGNDSHIMYAGTNGGGVYKSTDSGRSWENISRSTLNARSGQNWIDPYVKGNSAIAIDPDDHNTVYVGTGYLGSGNLFRSLDGGMNWNSNDVEEWNGLYNTNSAVLTVLCDDGGSDYVWMGTEGQGILYSEDGETFQPSGGTVVVNSRFGDDVIASPKVGYSAESEVWTLTCFVPDATINAPSIITAIDPIVIEENPYAEPPVLTASNPDTDGRIESFSTTSATKTETWTVTYVLEGVEVENITTGEHKGTVIDVEATESAALEHWTLTCIYVDINEVELLQGTNAIFRVESSVTGQQADATLNQPYTSDRINFTIIAGQSPFIVGDVIEFDTVQSAYWRVYGSISGQQENYAETGIAYVSDNREVGFTIEEGQTPFSDGDYFSFSTYEAKPAYWVVEGSLSGTQAGIAQTNQVYSSDNGEISFIIADSGGSYQDGDQITLQVTANKLSHGWTVWDLAKVPDTHGSSAELYAATSTGLYKSVNGGRTWDGLGRFTGDYINCMALYHTDSGTDIIFAGTENASVWGSYDGGMTWTQYSSGMSQGTTIKDILIDPYNRRLYSLACYGPSESATGQVFYTELDDQLAIASGTSWQESADGLSDSALYALGIDSAELSSEIYVGGEGIGFYRASSGVGFGSPTWQDSSQGLSNRIMARIPVLFSGETSLSYDIVQYDSVIFLTVYIQDVNGNPPIAGSTYTATFHDESAGEDYVWTDNKGYPDTYSYQGTYRDPGNGYTNNPYQYIAEVGSGDIITLTYTPTCNAGEDDDEAGCSGSEQTFTIWF